MISSVQIEKLGAACDYDGYVARSLTLPAEIALKLCAITHALIAAGAKVPGTDRVIERPMEAVWFLVDAATRIPDEVATKLRSVTSVLIADEKKVPGADRIIGNELEASWSLIVAAADVAMEKKHARAHN